MRVSRKPLLAAASVAVSISLFTASCGVAADDVAATYRDSEISTATVDAFAADEAVAQLLGYPVGEGESLLEGGNARTVLDFLLEGEALIATAEELGATIRGDEALLEQTLAGFAQQGFTFGIDDLSNEARVFLARFVEADSVLTEAAVQLGEPTEEEMRFVYAETADSGRWDRTCVTVVASLLEDTEILVEAFDGGLELVEVVTVAPQAQVVLDPSVACATAQDFAGLPPELAEGIDSAEAGVLVGPVEVASDAGPPLVVFFEVESRESVDFEAARPELEAEVAQSLLAVRIARESEVNPRYGDAPSLVAAQSQTGAPSLVARVQRPEAPEVIPGFGVQVP
ncbi:MAG: hypothetical protein ACR2OH_02845 [Microthrixaceae bacterium]